MLLVNGGNVKLKSHQTFGWINEDKRLSEVNTHTFAPIKNTVRNT